MLLNTLLLALRSIRRNLLRSFLTILGIVIGVSAVITMVTLGNGATLAVQNQISSLGTNLLQVRPGQRMGPGGGGGGAPAFKEADADAVASQIGGVAAVAPEARTGATLVAGGRNWTSSIIGSTNAWLHAGNWKLGEGRVFSEDELRAGAAVWVNFGSGGPAWARLAAAVGGRGATDTAALISRGASSVRGIDAGRAMARAATLSAAAGKGSSYGSA